MFRRGSGFGAGFAGVFVAVFLLVFVVFWLVVALFFLSTVLMVWEWVGVVLACLEA